MPRDVVALVSADDVIAAVRVHVDRVHDLLRRSGCGPAESIEVCESYALALIDTLVNAPETVGDLAGWWFGRALELGRRLGDGGAATTPAEEVPSSVLSGTTSEAQVREALAGLPQQERAAVLLRDGYDLPVEAVAVALGRSVDGAAATIAAGRLALISRHDQRAVPDLSQHIGRNPADRGMLGRLADGSLSGPRATPLRRHFSSCQVCEETVEQQARARRLVAALPVLAMPDEAREGLLASVTARADAVLPSVDEVLMAIEDDEDVRPLVSPVIVILAIVLALVLGVAVAAITTSDTGSGVFSSSSPTTEAIEQPSFPASPTLTKSPHATTTPSRPPRRTASPTTTAAATTPVTRPTHTPAARFASVQLSPDQGPRGTQISVTGSGWQPNETVSVSYTGTLASSRATAVTDAHGRFSATVTANGALPGTYTVSARGGSDSASATFTQSS